jgi:uncharacterized protein YjbJ (UPF0337 family)
VDWKRIEINWAHYKLLAAKRWAQITADEFDLIGGRRDDLAGHIAEVYRISKDAAQMQVESWQGQQREPAA